ncbi:MAG: anaerobic ribonucleoside-triphosphate reductase activating protein [Thermoguttaceae bacterium]|jgi:anaerobic ribonucleoside-triphosphate reductase activating protein|nr:anaerobic ribonucleoside-triphosphate reductase activating protein [Thermoguttaceae bacterium]
MKLRIAGCVSDSIVDGPGIRYALFTQGCPRRCEGCHNPQTHDPLGGVETTIAQILQEIDSNPLLDGVTFSGGEPFLQAPPLTFLARECQSRGLNVVVYTGYSWEELQSANNDDWTALLGEIDVLVDGPFVQELHDWKLKFMGSSNQRVIDVRSSLVQHRLVQLKSLEHMPLRERQ